MPNDNIEDYKKGGRGFDSENYEEYWLRPRRVAVIVGNDRQRNRTAGNQALFDRFGGNLGQTGASFLFEKKGLILIERQEASTRIP